MRDAGFAFAYGCRVRLRLCKGQFGTSSEAVGCVAERKSAMQIFTDGALEPDVEVVASKGDVMFGAASKHSELFGEELASTLVEQ